MGKHRRAGRQSVQPSVAAAGLGDVAAPSRVATDCAGATRCRRHIRAANGHGVESRNNEHRRQFCAAPHLRPAHPQMAQSVPMSRRDRRRRAGASLRSQGNAGSAASASRRSRTFSRAAKTTLARQRPFSACTSTSVPAPSSAGSITYPTLRAIDPSQRNYGQTPFDIGQCRRDCASFRAIEDRLQNVVDFFLTARPEDLNVARGVSRQELNTQLDQEFGQGAVALGRDVFARTCAGCHSSQSPPFDKANFHATDPKDPTLRLDFLSNEQPVLATRVGTYAGRALHSNHMPSRVWAEYAAITLRERPVDPALREIMKGSGRGYYRPPSLLSVWTQAPFMHNNAIGPEVCGKPSRRDAEFLLIALRRSERQAARQSAAVRAVRSERRGPLPALQGFDAGPAQSRAGVCARSRSRMRIS